MAKGMVIIGGDDYGKSMELVKCVKKAACELAETLADAHMSRREYEDDYDDDDEFDPEVYMEMMHRRGGGRSGGGRMNRRMPRGRYGY
mgnify:CR=1 FL=1